METVNFQGLGIWGSLFYMGIRVQWLKLRAVYGVAPK